MQTKRDRTLIVLLLANAAINAAAGSSYLAQLVSVSVVATVGLLNAMLSSITAAYVAISREPVASSDRPSDQGRYVP